MIRVGGVPEHFNYPFYLARDYGLYKKHNISVDFIIQKCGTGAMISALKQHNLDIIIALTEGLIQEMLSGTKIDLMGTYVESPLCWAISGKSNSTLKNLKNKKFGISRIGSGSHLMACVYAMQNNWDKNDISFKVVGDFESLRSSVNNNETDVFLWETFTSKPFYDSGELTRLGQITTPWPCFMIATLRDTKTKRMEEFNRFMTCMQEAVQIFKREKNKMPIQIAQKYSLSIEDVYKWYNQVNITASVSISKKAIDCVVKTLKKMNLVRDEDIKNFNNTYEFK